MVTKLMVATEKKIVASLEKGIKAGREIAIAVSTLFDKWEENDEYKLPAEWLAERFDFSKQYVYKMESIAKRFLTGDGCEKYDGFGVSVLMEALPLTDAQFEDFVDDCEQNDVKITQKAVREYVKKCKMLEAKEAEEAPETEEENAEYDENEGGEVPETEEEDAEYDENEVEEIMEKLKDYNLKSAKEAVLRLFENAGFIVR